MDTDNQLLERFARDGSEAAFRELVERHIHLVHSAALRESHGNASQAEDITQAVFTELARRPDKLVRHPALAGWLYTCVRRKTANVRRTEERRHRREREASIMNELLGSDPADQLWQEVRPVLDDAMHELNEEDRTVVVLRFFEGRSLKDIGLALGLSENAARMRVERSLERLRSLLARRGVKSTAATLATALASSAVLTAPSTLASTVATGALTTMGASGSSTFAIGKMLGITKTQIATVSTLVVAVALFTLWNKLQSNNSLPPRADPANPGSSNLAPIAAQSTGKQGTQLSAESASTNAEALPQMQLRLVDAETGNPIEGGKLYLAYFRQDGPTERQRRVTDAAGAASVDIAERPSRRLNMFVTADSHVPKVISWGYGRDMPSSYTMRMERGITISGLVVDESGLPIPDVKVEVDGPVNEPGREENIQFGPDTILHTDTDGRWTCNMIPKDAEDIFVILTHPDFAEAKAPVPTSTANPKELTITMPTGFVVAGIVEDSAGNAIEGAKLRQARLNGERERSQRTDAAGAFELRSLKAGEVLLAVQAKGYAPAAQTLQLTGSVTDLRFRLQPGRLLRGHVIDEDGKAVANARVETTPSDIDKVEWSGRADAGGRFAWDSAPEETLSYSIRAEGFAPAYGIKLLANGSDHEIRLARQKQIDGIQVTGTAIDADSGQPLGTFKVMRRDVEPEFVFPFEFAASGKDGRFTFSIPSNTRYRSCQLVIEKEGYLPELSATFARDGTNQNINFRLRKGSGPSGIVLLPDGSPAADAAVLLCTSGTGVTLSGPGKVGRGINTTTYRVQTDPAGNFALPAAISPLGVIAVHEEGLAESSLADLQNKRQLRLQPWGRVEGRLMLESKPAAGQEIVAFNQIIRYDEEGRRSGYLTYRLETTTDASGRFTFPKVPAGQCGVFRQFRQARHAFGSHRQSFMVAPGQTIQVTLGGSGRSIAGKARFSGDTGQYDWRGVLVCLRSQADVDPTLRPKRAAYSSLEDYIAASESFFEGYQKVHHYYALCDSNGAFRIPDNPAGTYTLEIYLRVDHANRVSTQDWDKLPRIVASLKKEIVLEVPDGQTVEALDLGILELTPESASTSGN